MYALQHSNDVDVRPRYFDKSTNVWSLVDTGAQVSCCPPQKGDSLDPTIILETVDGSKMPCYGTKQFSFRIGRKTYHQKVEKRWERGGGDGNTDPNIKNKYK